MRARYVAIEGIDGAGKSTFTQRLARALRVRGYRVRQRREPHDPTLGHFAQEVGAKDPWTSAVFFTLDRYLAREELERDLGRADVVLSDRSFYSTLAYQGSALPAAARKRLAAMQAVATRAPDTVILLDLPIHHALRRVGGRGRRRAPFERRATLERVGRAYRSLARRGRWVILDAREPAPQLVSRALESLSPSLGPRARSRPTARLRAGRSRKRARRGDQP